MAYKDDKHLTPAHEVRKRDRFDPLLVSLHDSARGYSQSKNDPNAINRLIDSIAMLLDAELHSNERALASDVLISLIKQAEKDVRESLSEKLAVREDLPDTLLHYLAYDEIDTAGPILRNSSLLSDMDLTYVIQSKQEEHWRAIAQRNILSDRIVKQLISKRDDATLITLLVNEGLELTDDLLREFVPAVKQSDLVATEFVNYKSLPKKLALEVYWHVSVILRNAIAERFNLRNAELDIVMEDCLQDFVDTMTNQTEMRPTKLMEEVAGVYMSTDRITADLLINTLRRRQGRFFIALFAKKTGLSHKIVHSLMKQVAGQGLAVACRACQIERQHFMSLFLIARAIAKPDKAVDAEELKMALRYYDGLSLKASRDILAQSIAQ